MSELKNGVELIEIVYPHKDFTVVDGETVLSITVCMQAGQMAGVPWAEVKNADGSIELVNLAHVESVTLKEPKP